MSSCLSRTLCLGLALWFSAGVASAQQLEEDAGEPAEHATGGITYLSGGIGADERTSLAARSRSYNLVLIFRLRNSSEALTDVAVTIASQMGDVLVDTLSEGPIFLARLPKGRYVVKAVYDGRPLKRTFIIGSPRKPQGRRFILRWNASGL